MARTKPSSFALLTAEPNVEHEQAQVVAPIFRRTLAGKLFKDSPHFRIGERIMHPT